MSPIDKKLALVQVMAWCRTNMQQAITWTNADQVHSYIYAAIGGDELILVKEGELQTVCELI